MVFSKIISMMFNLGYFTNCKGAGSSQRGVKKEIVAWSAKSAMSGKVSIKIFCDFLLCDWTFLGRTCSPHRFELAR